jgi:AcrR family transcriptional regulator
MKAEERKQLILDCSKKLFSTYGYYRTQISDITKEAQIARGTVYQYFKNKQDIFITLLETAYRQWEVSVLKDIAAIDLKTITPVSYLRLRIKTTVNFLVADPDIFNIAMTMGFGLPTELAEATRKLEEKIIIIANNDFKLGMHNNHIRENLNVTHVGEMMVGAIFSSVYFALLKTNKDSGKINTETLANEIVDLFAPGIFRPEALTL